MKIPTFFFAALIIPALLAAPTRAQQAAQPCGMSGAWNCASPSAAAAPAAASAPIGDRARSANACLLVKHKGTTGRRLAWFFLIGIPIAPGAKFDYVDAVNMRGVKLAYSGKDLQKLQTDGVHIIVLNDKFAAADLDSARNACASAPK